MKADVSATKFWGDIFEIASLDNVVAFLNTHRALATFAIIISISVQFTRGCFQ
jgi:hypothetical protein